MAMLVTHDALRTSVHQISCDAQAPLALTVVGLWGEGISDSRIVGAIFQFDRFSALQINWN
jgi:hypothetical protein